MENTLSLIQTLDMEGGTFIFHMLKQKEAYITLEALFIWREEPIRAGTADLKAEAPTMASKATMNLNIF